MPPIARQTDRAPLRCGKGSYSGKGSARSRAERLVKFLLDTSSNIVMDSKFV